MHQIKFLRQAFYLKIVKRLDNKPLWRQQNIRGPGAGAVSYDLGAYMVHMEGMLVKTSERAHSFGKWKV